MPALQNLGRVAGDDSNHEQLSSASYTFEMDNTTGTTGTGTIRLVRQGNIVSLNVTGAIVSSANADGTDATFTSASAIPVEFRPKYAVIAPFVYLTGATRANAYLAVSTAGFLTLARESAAAFPGSATVTLPAGASTSWIVA